MLLVQVICCDSGGGHVNKLGQATWFLEWCLVCSGCPCLVCSSCPCLVCSGCPLFLCQCSDLASKAAPSFLVAEDRRPKAAGRALGSCGGAWFVLPGICVYVAWLGGGAIMPGTRTRPVAAREGEGRGRSLLQ